MRKLYFLVMMWSLVPQYSWATDEIKKLPLLELLLSQGGKHDGEKVEVFGYLAFGGKLYLTKSHALKMNSPYSVSVLSADESQFNELNKCINQYVSVVGEIFVSTDGMVNVVHVKKLWSDKQICIKN